MDSTSPARGETDLSTLVSTLELVVHPSTFVFLTFPPAHNPPQGLLQQMTFHESEGLTVISTLDSAQEHRLDYTFPSRMITCNIHSSLEAVGFLAEIAKVMTAHSIGVNPVSGFYHDHLFIPLGKEQKAIAALNAMVTQAKSHIGTSG